jgi:hypothetical protein
MTLVNGLLTSNVACADGGERDGGGIDNDSGRSTPQNDTIKNNTSGQLPARRYPSDTESALSEARMPGSASHQPTGCR